MLLTRNFQNGRDSLSIIFQYMPDVSSNVLIDKDDTNIISLRKVEEGLLNLLNFGISFDNKKVG